MADTPTDRIALSAPRGIVALLITGILSGGIGATATGMTLGGSSDKSYLSRAEVEAVATQKATEAASGAREDCRRELAASMTGVSASLARIESAVTKLTTDTEQLKIDVAAMKARR